MIPNQIHFTYTTLPDIEGKPFALIHYLAVKSAALVNRCPVFCHVEVEPTGPWWEKAQRYMRPVVTTVPREIAGIPLRHPAHRSDVLRLQVLRERGGIYLDLDIICVKPFADLLVHRFVLGRESSTSVCTGVIMAEAGLGILDLWLEGYDPKTSLTCGFRSQGLDRYWSEMSSGYGTLLADQFPELVTLMPERDFHFPIEHRETEQMFIKRSPPLPPAYCYHLYESRHWHRFSQLTIDRIRSTETNFGQLLQPLVIDE